MTKTKREVEFKAVKTNNELDITNRVQKAQPK